MFFGQFCVAILHYLNFFDYIFIFYSQPLFVIIIPVVNSSICPSMCYFFSISIVNLCCQLLLLLRLELKQLFVTHIFNLSFFS